MLRKMLSYGVAAGLIAGVPFLVLMLIGGSQLLLRGGLIFGYTVMLIGFSTIFLAIKRQRDIEGGGIIRFWPAFVLGLGITVVASLVYALSWEVSIAATGADFMSAYAQATIAEQRAAGATAQQLAKLQADMDSLSRSYANPLFRVPMTMSEILPVGLLVSLICAGLLRNPRFMPVSRAAAT